LIKVIFDRAPASSLNGSCWGGALPNREEATSSTRDLLRTHLEELKKKKGSKKNN